ncbi:MAG: FHA domain-containing protein [Thermotogae bacterium]|nr:FHA domain-containing protein [Thermotogota bacterium]
MLKVRIKIGEREREITIRRVPFVIGGSAKSDLFVIGAPPEFAVIDRSGDAYILKVKGKGVSVNGTPNVKEAELVPGTEVDFLGRVKMVVVEAPEPSEGTSQPTQFLEADEPPYFKIIAGPNSGEVIEIVSSGILGRSPDVEYRVSDPHTSREHLRIHFLGDGVEVENLSETNPTLLNKKPLNERTKLKSGDILKVGRMALLYVNPTEKPETELLAVGRRANRWLFGAIGGLAVLVAVVASLLYFNQRKNEAQSNLSLAVSTFAAAENEGNPERIRENYKLVKEYAQRALSINKNLIQAKDYLKKADSLLSAWDKVVQAKKLMAQNQLDKALAKLDSVAPILGDKPQFAALYAPLLNRIAVEENVAVARKFMEEGKYDEALKALEVALSIDPENEDLQALKATLLDLKSSKKPVKIEEVKKVFAKKREEVKQRYKKPAKSKKIASKSTNKNERGGLKAGSIALKKEQRIDVSTSVSLPSVKVDLGTPKPAINLASSQTIDKQRQMINAYRRGDLRTVKRLATDILSENPRNATARRYQQLAELESKALAYEKAGNKQEALKYWRLVLRYDKSNARAKRAIQRLSQ